MSKESANKTQTHKVSVYIPSYHYHLLVAIADKNMEPLSNLVKRLLLPEIEESASSSFRASNALHSALKNNELTPTTARKILDFLTSRLDMVHVEDEADPDTV
jgi:hypothetical protein